MEELITQDYISPIASEKIYKMIPLRGVVAFPGQTITFDLIRDKSLFAFNKAMEEQQEIFLVLQKSAITVTPTPKDIYRTGCIARVKQLIRMPNDAVRVTAYAVDRATIASYKTVVPYFEVTLNEFPIVPSGGITMEALSRKLLEQFLEYQKLNTKMPPEVSTALRAVDIHNFVALAGIYIIRKDSEKQKLLELNSEEEQAEFIYSYLVNECEILTIERKIMQKVRGNIEKNQKEVYLREQVKVIHEELGGGEKEYEEFREKAEKKKLPAEVVEKIEKEIKKLERSSASSPENGVSRTYIEWLLDLPWNESTKDNKDLKKAREILDKDHYGIDKIKERIIEYLAVLRLTKEISGPILCFVGPPGVGKTSVVESIARAAGRKFVTMSLGGVRDEAEIRGHRRTYIGSLPGRIISAMKNAGTTNPVFLLDEIDKMSSDFRGDPSSALLEVLDPNQNNKFKDHYLEVPYDLSKVMFVTTANNLADIPLPLLDRMEIIELSGYTYEEKLQIAKKYLLPKQIKANGLTSDNVSLSDALIKNIIACYTRESGVRNLERKLGSVCRKIAVRVVNGDLDKKTKYKITAKDIIEFLGVEKYSKDKQVEADEIGTATGLAYTSYGGSCLNIEVALIPNGKGDIILTGSLGDVMKESCQTALSLVKARAVEHKIAPESFKTNDVHLHFPEGATPKDGPSAGITIATALLSAFSGKKVSKAVAMTGEVTLRGKVLAIGGLKEKSLAAFRTGIKKIIIPIDNKKDVVDLPKEVLDNINFTYATTIDNVFDVAIV